MLKPRYFCFKWSFPFKIRQEFKKRGNLNKLTSRTCNLFEGFANAVNRNF